MDVRSKFTEKIFRRWLPQFPLSQYYYSASFSCLRGGYGSQKFVTAIAKNLELFRAKNQRNGFLVLWDCSRFDRYRTAKGKIVTAVTNLSEAARIRQRRYKIGPEPQPPTIQGLLKRAYQLKRRMEENAGMTRAGLAREEGLDPSFLTRILNLLKLAPEIQRHILAMPPSEFQSPFSE